MNSKACLITLIIILLSFLSCYDNHRLIEEIQQLKNNPIDIDICKRGISFKNGVDTIYCYDEENPYRLIIYIDSLSCNQCFITHMIESKECITELSSLGIESIFIFEPKKEHIEEISSLLKDFAYPFWTIVMRNAEFSEVNPHIPSTPNLRSFLLNKENKVVVVGNPFRNIKIKALIKTSLKNEQER